MALPVERRRQEHFQNTFWAISEQFHNNFTTIFDHFLSYFRANSEQLQSIIAPYQSKSSFRAVSEQFQNHLKSFS